MYRGPHTKFGPDSGPLTDDPGREEDVLDSLPLFFPALPCTGDAMALRLPEGGLLAERGWDEVGGREPGKNNKKQESTLFI